MMFLFLHQKIYFQQECPQTSPQIHFLKMLANGHFKYTCYIVVASVCFPLAVSCFGLLIRVDTQQPQSLNGSERHFERPKIFITESI